MTSLLLYSTNPWITLEIGRAYRHGKYSVWCSEHYNPAQALGCSADALVAPSSSPKGIYDRLSSDCHNEDRHSALIKGYRKTFRQLAKRWLQDVSITQIQQNEIIATMRSHSWNIWRPVLFLIPRENIEPSRILSVDIKERAAYGPEFKICDLHISEFDVMER